MRFKLDENIPLELQRLFQEAGHDAVTVLDKGMLGASDSDIASVCLAEDRILVTQDKDFADIKTYPPMEYPGFVVLRLAKQGREELLSVGARVMGTLTETFSRGQLWVVENSRIRIRD